MNMDLDGHEEDLIPISKSAVEYDMVQKDKPKIINHPNSVNLSTK